MGASGSANNWAFGYHRQGPALGDCALEMVRKDRKWNEEAARKQLVKFFEALGPADPLAVQGRRRLSSILFA